MIAQPRRGDSSGRTWLKETGGCIWAQAVMGQPKLDASLWRSALYSSTLTSLLDIALVRVAGGAAVLWPDVQAACSSPVQAFSWLLVGQRTTALG